MDVAVSVTEEQRIIVRERLRLLSIACYVRGGIIAAFSSFFLIYVIFMFGITMVPDSAWADGSNSKASATPGLHTWSASPTPTPAPQGPPKAVFRIIAGIFGFFLLLGWTIGGLTAYAGWCIHQRRRKVLVYIAAGLNCFFIPYGTLLGIATLLVMSSAGAQLEFQTTQTV